MSGGGGHLLQDSRKQAKRQSILRSPPAESTLLPAVNTPAMDETPLDATIEEPNPYSSPSTASEPRAQGWRDAVDNPWLMLAMLFFVTAALGLPFLWISRGFSTFWKIVLTVLVTAWTVLILWVFWLIMVWCYTRITDAL
jgi:hypothetical protein